MHLQLDIHTLEKIYILKKLREVNANADYEKLIERTKNEQKSIEAIKNNEIKVLSMKADALRQEQNYANSIKILELEIRKLDVDDIEKKNCCKKRIIY